MAVDQNIVIKLHKKARSPDLNPLDFSTWSILETRVLATPHTSLQSLKAKLQREWEAIPQEQIRAACHAFVNRLKAVLYVRDVPRAAPPRLQLAHGAMLKFHYTDEVNQNILLVKAVQQEPEVYDHTLPGYSNRDSQEQAWHRVAEAVGDSVPACRSRWMNLRGSMCRHIRQSMVAGSGPLKKPYYMAKYMAFLIPFTKVRALQTFGEKSKSNKQFPSFNYQLDDPTDETERNDDDCDRPEIECTNIKLEIDEMQFDEAGVDQSCPDAPALKKIKIDENSATSSNIDDSLTAELKDNFDVFFKEGSKTDAQKRSLDKNNGVGSKQPCKYKADDSSLTAFNVDDSSSCENEDFTHLVINRERTNADLETKNAFTNQDPDLSFLVSLLPDIKKMSDKKKSEFKISILQTIHSEVYNS
ncbi:BESS motif [Trinorchestia longiramus]|nr:BESS motif [Trinorchestia longiramus]